MKKYLSTTLIISGSLLTVAAISVPVAVVVINNQSTTQVEQPKYDHDKPFAYNEYLKDFHNSQPTIKDDDGNIVTNPYYNQDLQMERFYNANTLPISIIHNAPQNDSTENNTQSRLITSISSGTMWNINPEWIGKKNDNPLENRTFLATNIHVVKQILILGKDAEGKNSINISNDYKVYANFKNTPQEENRKDVSRVELEDLKVEKIALTNKYSLGEELPKYSDFIVLSCANKKGEIFPSDALQGGDQSKINLIDTDSEFNDIMNKLLYKPNEMPIYIAGYPSTDPKGLVWKNEYDYKYVTIRYMHEGLKLKQSTAYKELGKEEYEKEGLKIFSNSADLYHSFSNQLIMPNLHIPKGSSGSLVSVVYQEKITPLGIWWGEYYSPYSPFEYGALDFFYSPPYFLENNNDKVLRYDLFKLPPLE